LRPGLDPDLEAICLRCLARDPAQRYRDAAALADDLARYLDGREVLARPLGRSARVARAMRREPRLTALLALLLSSLALGMAATSLQWRRAEANAAQASHLLWEGRREAAAQLQTEGRGFEAMPRLALNIAEQEARGLDAWRDRLEAGVLRAQLPVLLDSFRVEDAVPLATALSPSGRTLALALDDYSVRWYDLERRGERGRVSVLGRPTESGHDLLPTLLRFVDERRLIVSLDWYRHLGTPPSGDAHLIDTERGGFFDPPAGAGAATLSFSQDAGHALLMRADGGRELWQVEGWRRLASAPRPEQYELLATVASGAAYVVTRRSMAASLELWSGDAFLRGDPRTLELHGGSGISARAETRDGSLLALADFRGAVFLAEPLQGRVRRLPSALGARVNWLAFSADERWLAAAGADGSVQAFEVESGLALSSGLMQHAFAIERVGIDRAQRLLVAAGQDQVALWRLPAPGPTASAPQRLPAGPLAQPAAGLYAQAWSLSAGLLAAAGRDGEVRIWRLPEPSQQPAQAARLAAERLVFDGRRLIDLEWNWLRVFDLDTGRGGEWRELEQPPVFAELLGGGERLLLVLGSELRILDSSRLRPVNARLALPATPLHLEVDAAGRRAVLAFPTTHAGGFGVTLRQIDLVAARFLPGEATMAGPLRLLRLSPGQDRVLAVGDVDGATLVLEAQDLVPVARFPHGPELPVLWADWDEGGEDIWLVLRAQDEGLAEADSLVRWSPRDDEWIKDYPLPNVRPFALATFGERRFVVGWKQSAMDPGRPAARAWPHRGGLGHPTSAIALTPDRSLLAHAYGQAVQLYDPASRQPLGEPLRAALASDVLLSRLAFSPDGRRLLARDTRGGQHLWQVAPERAPADRLARLALGGDDDTGAGRRPLSERLSPREPGVRPLPACERLIDGVPLPARPSAASPLQLDLSAQFNLAPDSRRSGDTNVFGSMRGLPAGLLRLGEVDFDLRGAIQLNSGDAGSSVGDWTYYAPRHARGIAVPDLALAAIHVLMAAPLFDPIDEERDYARVRLHYRDGSQAVLSLRTLRDVPGNGGADGAVRFAWADFEPHRLRGYARPLALVAPRLENPWPDRRLRALDLESVEPELSAGPGSRRLVSAPVFFALSLEPVIDAASGVSYPVVQASSGAGEGPAAEAASSRPSGSPCAGRGLVAMAAGPHPAPGDTP
jgi:hypothetical protein